ncbi:unnamed protein product [Sphenostylis stenocarpa]|uniref:TSL-kinase interacting protein 1 n=1 Tax=Sphenostylis stenocarpa TaxID=92480 RepID=A0AA86S188_9FABA|nr:unnamed protein product [Sphenostylis stenocarpa]
MMKKGRSVGSKVVRAPAKCNLKTGSIGVRNSPKRTNKLDHKARGYSEELLTDKENQHLLFKEHMSTCPEPLNKDTFISEKKADIELHPGEMLTSSKIKLQLFPINEGTRIGLEQDGHNPYLELTLRGRKKISSILKHLGKKWGSSSMAKGELILFPYNIMENLSDSRRWTINDSDATASAVYAAVGSPSIFRLKYGWFYIHEPRSSGIPSTPTSYKPVVAGGGNANLEETLCGEQDMVETSKEYKATDVGSAVGEPRVSSDVQQSSSPWLDSLSNISIGAFLSEASLFGGLDPKSFAGIQPCDITSDSLDAFIAAQINNRPVSRLSGEDLRTSILDAEETCHAFPLQKLSSPTDVLTSGRKDYSVACNQDVSSNLLKLSNTDKCCIGSGTDIGLQIDEGMRHVSIGDYVVVWKLRYPSLLIVSRGFVKVNDQDGPSPNPPSGKTQTDQLLSSRPYDDERSLGLTNINWNDSMGPFDLGMPAKKPIGGDSISIGGLVK